MNLNNTPSTNFITALFEALVVMLLPVALVFGLIYYPKLALVLAVILVVFTITNIRK